MSFVKRKVDIAIKLAANTQLNQPITFSETSSDVITLSGTRISARVQNAGAIAGQSATVSIWGLRKSLINQLSTLGMVVSVIPRNILTITAGNVGGAMSTVFVGTIIQAYPDFKGAPDVPFRFECQTAAAEQVIPFPASSYTGASDVAVVLSAIASQAGWGFENNGVSIKISNPYLAGSAVDQVRQIATWGRFHAQVINNVLCIWPLYGSRSTSGNPIPLIGPTSGLISYPSFVAQGITVETEFRPEIIFGGQIKVDSSLFDAQSLQLVGNPSSIWNVNKLDLSLDAEMPKGQWKSTIIAYNQNYERPLPQAPR